MKSWIADAIIYQVNLRGLAAREPRNAFEAAREKKLKDSPLAYVARNLDYIRDLGATVVYFMPPYPIGRAFRKGIGSPYSIRDFRAIEPEYGSKREMAALVRKAHRLGLKVIFDITPNHTSRDNVWITQHPEFYVKRDNGEVFFDCDWSDTAKLDYTEPALRREMLEIYDHWLSFLGKGDGIDGFRLDMAHFINDKSFWNDAMPELRRRHADRELLFLAECYGFEPNCDLFARGINAAYDDDFYKCCQWLYGVDEDHNTVICPAAGLDQNHDFRDRHSAFLSGGIAGAFARALQNYEDRYSSAQTTFLARYTDNHDEGRGMYLYGEGAVRAVNALAFTTRMTLPFILTGEEFGAVNRPPIHDRMNPIGKKRRIRRADGSVWEQESVEFEGNSFARDPKKRAELLRYFKSLIKLRRATPALVHGTQMPLDVGEQASANERAVIAFERKLGKTVLRVAINLGPEPRKLARAAALRGSVIWGRFDDQKLAPFGGVVVRISR